MEITTSLKSAIMEIKTLWKLCPHENYVLMESMSSGKLCPL